MMASTPHESFRAPPLEVHTPDGERATLIVTRQGGHRAGPVWLTWHGSWRLTMCLTDAQVDELAALLHRAKGARL